MHVSSVHDLRLCYYYLYFDLYVFPCVLLVDNYVSLNQSDLNFHFWHCDFDDLYGDVDVFISLY